MGKLVQPDGGSDASVLSLLTGGRGRRADSRQRMLAPGMDHRPICAYQGRETPGRVVHSAKSWLCHHAADRSERFLPWGSEDISPRPEDLTGTRLCADPQLCAGPGTAGSPRPGLQFNDQDITITVPASFDAAAQRLTLTAAAEAGFPDTVRLLEEPQAALYCWLEQHDSDKGVVGHAARSQRRAHHLLVIDIGGGTSDFSLFEFRSDGRSSVPDIRRVAVSEHILLGGDNVDLAIAHLVEPRLLGDGRQLSGTQWDHLVAHCRDLKEKALSSAGRAGRGFPSLASRSWVRPGRGSAFGPAHTRRDRTCLA